MRRTEKRARIRRVAKRLNEFSRFGCINLRKMAVEAIERQTVINKELMEIIEKKDPRPSDINLMVRVIASLDTGQQRDVIINFFEHPKLLGEDGGHASDLVCKFEGEHRIMALSLTIRLLIAYREMEALASVIEHGAKENTVMQAIVDFERNIPVQFVCATGGINTDPDDKKAFVQLENVTREVENNVRQAIRGLENLAVF